MTTISTERLRTTEARERVRNMLHEMRAVEFQPPDDDSSEPIDVLEFEADDEWADLEIWNEYAGRLKCVSNGNADSLRVMWQWNRASIGRIAEHRHPHEESFIVTRGWMQFKIHGRTSTYRIGEGRAVPEMTPHEMVACSADAECFIVWWRNG